MSCKKEFLNRSCIRYFITNKDKTEFIGICGFPSSTALWDIHHFSIAYALNTIDDSTQYEIEIIHALTTLAFKSMHAKKVTLGAQGTLIPNCAIPFHLNFKVDTITSAPWNRQGELLAHQYTYSIESLEDLPELNVPFSSILTDD